MPPTTRRTTGALVSMPCKIGCHYAAKKTISTIDFATTTEVLWSFQGDFIGYRLIVSMNLQVFPDAFDDFEFHNRISEIDLTAHTHQYHSILSLNLTDPQSNLRATLLACFACAFGMVRWALVDPCGAEAKHGVSHTHTHTSLHPRHRMASKEPRST